MTQNSTSTRNIRFALAVFVLAVVFAISMTAAAQSAESGSSRGLSGTWRVQVALQNCATHVQMGPPFVSMLSFHRGGTLSGTTANPAFAPGQRTSDYGIWSSLEDGNYTAASEAYILFPAGPFVAGTQRIVQAISVNGDRFTSTATVQFMDVNHVQVLGACAVATGTRFN